MESTGSSRSSGIDGMAALPEILEFPSRNWSPKNAEPADGKEEYSPSSGHRSGSSIGSSQHVKKRKHRNSRVTNVTRFDSRVSNAHIEEAGKNKSSPLWSFGKGDIVWAKAFPYTWWPGRIDEMKGSKALVSFFGCHMTRWFQVSEIRGFEENYTRMSKMVGLKLSEEISLALKELSRRTVLELTCSCQDFSREANDISPNRISEAKKCFEPTKMLGFVLDMAVSPQFGDGETANIVRESAHFNAYWLYVSVCRNPEANGGCHEADWDVSSCIDEEETTGVHNTESQFNACQHNTVLGDIPLSNESKGSDQEVPELSFESTMVCGVNREPEDVFVEVFEEQVQEGREICMINRPDFSILDSDEAYESLLDNQIHAVTSWSVSAGLDICMNGDLEKQNSCTGSSSQGSNVEAPRDKSFTHASDGIENAANGIAICAIEGSTNSLSSYDANHMRENIVNILGSDHVVQSRKDGAFSSNLMTTPATDIVKQHETTTTVEHETNVSAALLVSTSDNCLVKTAPCEEEQLLIYVSSKCDTHSPDVKLKNSVKFQSSPKVSLVVDSENADTDCTANGVSGLSLSAKSGSVQKMCDQAITLNNKLVTTLETEMVKQQDQKTTTVGHETNDSAALLASTSDSCLFKIAPCKEQLLLDLSSKGTTHSPDEMLKHIVKFQSSPKSGLLVENGNADKEGTANIVSCLPLPAKMASESIQKLCDQTITCNKSFKLQKNLTPYSNTISYSSSMIECQSSTSYRSHSNHEVVADAATKKALFSANADNDILNSNSGDRYCIVSRRNIGKGDNTKISCSLTLPRPASKSSFQRKKGLDQSTASGPSKWQDFYSSPLIRDCSNSSRDALRSSTTDRSSSFIKSLHMKFPKDFNLPSKEELVKKFRVFGPLDCSKTRLFFYTGSSRVVFIREADAYAAYQYVKKRNVFGEANVRFWLDDYEKYRKVHRTRDSSVPSMEDPSSNLKSCIKELSIPIVDHLSLDLKSCSEELSRPILGHTSLDLKSCTQDLSVPIGGHSSSNLKSCLKRPKSPNVFLGREMEKKCKVRFLMET